MDDETVPASEETSYAATEPAADPVQTETAATDPVDVTVPLTAPETVPEISEDFPVESTIVEDPEELDGTDITIYEDFSGSEYEEYTAATEAVNMVDVIESVGSDIAHTNLFGSFLICGTLIGLALLRKIYGT